MRDTRGQPAQFGVMGVIPGFSEGLQLMTVGSQFRFVIPSDIAYGAQGAGGDLKVAEPQDKVENLLGLFPHVLQVYDSEDEAIRSFKKAARAPRQFWACSWPD